ncbi:MAG: sigma-E factor negative regulatory protein [Lysobacteraceae bacterium]
MSNNDMHDQALHEDLSAFMDGELDAERARFLQQRLSHDAELRSRWERWQLLSSSMRRQAQPLPDGFADRVATALAAETVQVTPIYNHALRWAGGAALAVSLSVAGVFVFDAMHQPQPVLQMPVAPQIAAVHAAHAPATHQLVVPQAIPAQSIPSHTEIASAVAVKTVAPRSIASRTVPTRQPSADRVAEVTETAIKLPIPVQSGVVTAFRSPLRPLLMRRQQQHPNFAPFPQPYPIDPELEAYLQQQKTGANHDVFARDGMNQPGDSSVRQVAWPQDGQH